MKAMRLTDSARALVEEAIPQPQPGPGEVLIRVYAAGVTPTERRWYPTSHSRNGERRTRTIPAHEFSGVIAALGKQVTGFAVGQEVYGMNDWFSDGALAEYCITKPSWIASKPSHLTHVQAASVPIGALTAWQGLLDRARLQAGESVLVQGGAGAVGIFAVQIARSRGAHVMATASARNLELVSRLGAEQAIDYRAVRFEESIPAVDVVFDTVGGETLDRSWGVLKPGGRMITIAAENEAVADERVKRAFFIVEPNHQQLAEIGDLLQSEQLRPIVDAVLPLDRASEAYQGQVRERSGRGKMVVTVIPDGSRVRA
jgi:NADPH:quinone reductase-like Zn-dependent oxidoreductase